MPLEHDNKAVIAKKARSTTLNLDISVVECRGDVLLQRFVEEEPDFGEGSRVASERGSIACQERVAARAAVSSRPWDPLFLSRVLSPSDSASLPRIHPSIISSCLI